MSTIFGDVAPDFEADAIEGHISFHDWIGDGRTLPFPHPRKVIPVCPTGPGRAPRPGSPDR